MKSLLDLYKLVLDQGTWTQNRTGIRTCTYPGAELVYDLAEGFPAVTTRKLAFKSISGELCAFLRGETSAAAFRALGCGFWDGNANGGSWLTNPFRDGTDALGKVYGAHWRKWEGYRRIRLDDAAYDARRKRLQDQGFKRIGLTDDGGEEIYFAQIDQLARCLKTLVENPSDRRILFHGWDPATLEDQALPACHLLYQFLPNVSTRELSIKCYVRSWDLGLGSVANIAETAMLLSLVARLTGFTPRFVKMSSGDTHIYENQLDMVREMMTREPYAPPRLVISDRVPDFAKTGKLQIEWLDLVEPTDFALEGYQHHAPLTAAMAV